MSAKATRPNPCGHKKPYDTRRLAKIYARRYMAENGRRYRPYQCQCSWWHLTTLPAHAITTIKNQRNP